MLSGEGEEGRDAEGDPGGDGFGTYPEGDPRHDDNQTRRDVGVEDVVAQTTFEMQFDLQAGEVTCRVRWKTESAKIARLPDRQTVLPMQRLLITPRFTNGDD